MRFEKPDCDIAESEEELEDGRDTLWQNPGLAG
jgi:hypothetical protein